MVNSQIRKGLGFHTTLAANYLAEGKIGDTITREKMTEIIKRSCNPNTRDGQLGLGNVRSAQNYVERQHGIIWDWVRAEQVWRCLADKDRLELARARASQGSRKIKRSNQAATCIDQSKLEKDDRDDLQLLTIQNSFAIKALSNTLKRRVLKSGRPIKTPDYEQLSRLITGDEEPTS